MLYASLPIAVLAIIVVVSAVRLFLSRPSGGGLTDEQIRRIETEGWIELEEPLDWDEIRAAERRFWEETWDRPDEEW